MEIHAVHRDRQCRRQCHHAQLGRTTLDVPLNQRDAAIPFFSSTLISHSVPLNFMLADNSPSPSVHVAASAFGSFFLCPFRRYSSYFLNCPFISVIAVANSGGVASQTKP